MNDIDNVIKVYKNFDGKCCKILILLVFVFFYEKEEDFFGV